MADASGAHVRLVVLLFSTRRFVLMRNVCLSETLPTGGLAITCTQTDERIHHRGGGVRRGTPSVESLPCTLARPTASRTPGFIAFAVRVGTYGYYVCGSRLRGPISVFCKNEFTGPIHHKIEYAFLVPKGRETGTDNL